jgi:hypothetical protein
MEWLSAAQSSDEGHAESAGDTLQSRLANEAVKRLNSGYIVLAKNIVGVLRSKNF